MKCKLKKIELLFFKHSSICKTKNIIFKKCENTNVLGYVMIFTLTGKINFTSLPRWDMGFSVLHLGKFQTNQN